MITVSISKSCFMKIIEQPMFDVALSVEYIICMYKIRIE